MLLRGVGSTELKISDSDRWRHFGIDPPPDHQNGPDSGEHAPADELFRELDCVRDLLPAPVIAAAEQRARRVGTGADRTLIAGGHISEEEYLRRLAQSLGISFDDLADAVGRQCPLDQNQLIDAARTGIVPLRHDGNGLVYVVAPRGTAARRIAGLAHTRPEALRSLRLTTSDRLMQFAMRDAGETAGHRASDMLARLYPALSAGPPRWRFPYRTLCVVTTSALAIEWMWPDTLAMATNILLSAFFVAWTALRVVGLIVRPPPRPSGRAIADRDLPVYTIMVALYREASSVDGLLTAIGQLDYPREKLDVKIIVETDDAETRAALAAARSGLPFDTIVVPRIGPRTKPKALNVALSFVRGDYLVIYDAEDRPEPDQLRRALDRFRASDAKLACVQASLTIDNTADTWLTAVFTAEYAGQFDVFLPALSALDMPLPLGGSSNHFRARVLRTVGGWDPFNVTEDADLGMRLARFGYRSAAIDSATFEEAPATIGPWLRQRTRWFKGWMQTWLVHMRAPRRLARELGWPGFLVFQLMVGGNALAALIHPLFLVGFAISVLSGQESTNMLLTTLFGATVVAGYLVSIVISAMGLARRGLTKAFWSLTLVPFHWLLLSLAAWRALFQLMFDPYRWEKTDHGHSRTSRLARRQRAQSIVARILGA